MNQAYQGTNGGSPRAARVLVVSRQPSLLGPLWSVAENHGWDLEITGSGCEALERVQGQGLDLVLLDCEEGDSDGLSTLRWLRRVRAELPIVLLAKQHSSQQKLEALRLGAQEYLARPVEERELEQLLLRSLNPELRSRGDLERGQGSPLDGASQGGTRDPKSGLGSVEELQQGRFFLAAIPIMQKLRAQAELLAQVDVPVLITGESGSGKATVARLIHQRSARAAFGFHSVNCAALSGDLLERELLGYEPGAFPGASRSKPGRLEMAERGTILLHDVVETPLALQAKLLHVLQEREHFRLGGENRVAVEARIVAATSQELGAALAVRRMREDLYYRLSAFTVHVPPLRQRRAEIPLLLEHFMKQLARHYGLPPRSFSGEWMEACQEYDWPGNLRELEGLVKRYLVMGDQGLVDEILRRSRPGGAGSGNGHWGRDPAEGDQTQPWSSQSWPPAGMQSPPRAAGQGPAAHSGQDRQEGREEHGAGGPETSGLRSLVESVKGRAERDAIHAALERTRWNRKAAARLLKVSYRTLLYKIQQYRMAPPGVCSNSPVRGLESSSRGSRRVPEFEVEELEWRGGNLD